MQGFDETPYGPATMSCSLCQGIGEEFSMLNSDPVESDNQLIGFIKNGVQYGTVYTDAEITSISESEGNGTHIFLRPTITNSNTYLHSSPNFSQLTFTLYDLTGRTLLNQPIISSRTPIDCRNLPSAVYIWRGCDEQQNVMAAGKLVKQ